MNDAAEKLTWQALLARWGSHSVPLIRVLPPEHRAASFYQRTWVNTDGTDWGSFSNPVNTTGRHLANGEVTKKPEVFAAFAISTFLRDERVTVDGRVIVELIERSLQRCEVSLLDCWTYNPIHVLPRIRDSRHKLRNRHHWTAYVDAAAKRWSELAADFSVVLETQHVSLPSRLIV
jgi:hypothetical protein